MARKKMVKPRAVKASEKKASVAELKPVAVAPVKNFITEKKKKKKKRKESFSIYINKVLQQVHPGSTMSKRSMSIMNSFVNDVFDRFATEAIGLQQKNKTNTLTSREIQTSIRLLLPGELAKHAGISHFLHFA